MAETKTKPDLKEQAKLAVDPASRQAGQADALAAQLEQQEEARGDVADAQEQADRAAHSAEGGGAWPTELLQSKFLTPQGPVAPAFAPEQNYTSHETEK